MEALVQFIKRSQELKILLKSEISFEQRDQSIEKIDEILQERQQLLNKFPDLSSLKESTKLELVSLEKDIKDLMEKQKELIKHDLKMLQLKKQKENQYSNPYGNLSVDGMFLDKKK